MAAILDAGYNMDFIDAATIDKLGTIPYPILVIPPTDRISLATYKSIEGYAKAGHVIAVGKMPSLAPGLKDQKDSAKIQLISSHLFKIDGGRGVLISSQAELADALFHALPPDLHASGETDGLGFIHRKLPGRDIYFVANTGNRPILAQVRFRSSNRSVQAWDPDSGRIVFHADPGSGQVQSEIPGLTFAQTIALKLAPYESRIFILSGARGPVSRPEVIDSHGEYREVANLSRDWTIRFNSGHAFAGDLDSFVSWTRMPDHEFYSGEATYTRTFTLDQMAPQTGYWLDFGPGRPIPDDRPTGANGMHALLDPPIREAAIVFVNGQRAGALWHPPYRLDITSFVHPGENKLEIHVFNTAINELAGQSPRDLTALRAKYGARFEPQDQDRIHPVPSGLLGPVRLLTSSVR